MNELVVTVLGRDRAGLVEALSAVVSRHRANWEQSSMAELAGVFAGVVLVRVPAGAVDALLADLDQLEADGLLRLEAELAPTTQEVDGQSPRYQVAVTGQDSPGIVHEITRQLTDHAISIDSFTSEVVPAPLGGQLFNASLVVRPQSPPQSSPEESPESTWSLDDLQELF